MSGRVIAIYLAAEAGAAPGAVAQAELQAGRGIVGDRYYRQTGTFSESLKQKGDWEATLIALEEIERYGLGRGAVRDPGSFRRNIVTQGIALNDLVGRRFTVGEAVLVGTRLCEPCAHLAKLLGGEVAKEMLHRAGLRARILGGATIRPGDVIQESGATPA